jgi:hypothetical protein
MAVDAAGCATQRAAHQAVVGAGVHRAGDQALPLLLQLPDLLVQVSLCRRVHGELPINGLPPHRGPGMLQPFVALPARQTAGLPHCSRFCRCGLANTQGRQGRPTAVD